jgi:predicted CopG family antitoxin
MTKEIAITIAPKVYDLLLHEMRGDEKTPSDVIERLALKQHIFGDD